MKPITIARALSDKRLLGADLGDLSSWAPWIAVLSAAFGLPLTPDQAAIFNIVAGGRAPPGKRVRELWAVVGRRGGKSRMAAALAIFIAIFIKHVFASGERPMVLVVAGSLDQAKTVFGYVRGFLEASPALRKEIVNITRQEIVLKNGIMIAVHTNSFRTVRGRTLCAAIFDEVAFWRDESTATPDGEMYTATLPALLTTHGMLIGISTPYRRVGLLAAKHKRYWAVDDPNTLVVQGSSQTFHPALTDEDIDAQREADPTAAPSEWDAQFRNDLTAFLDDPLIDAAVEHGRPLELAPIRDNYRFYNAFCDASGGTGGDSYTLGVGHKEGELFVIDLVRGTTGRFDPQGVTQNFADVCKEYGCSTVTGDGYSAEWVAQAWRNTGIAYVKSDTVKSQIYLNCVPLFTRGLVRLPDHAKLLRELRLLERQLHRGGKESVDHPRGGHDDYANVVCGVLYGLSLRLGYDTQYRGWDPDYRAPDAPANPIPAANQRLLELYQSIDGAIRSGMMR